MKKYCINKNGKLADSIDDLLKFVRIYNKIPCHTSNQKEYETLRYLRRQVYHYKIYTHEYILFEIDRIILNNIRYDTSVIDLDYEIEKKEAIIYINKLFNELSSKEKKVIEFRYYSEETLEGTGKLLGVGRERIRQIENRVMHKLSRTIRRDTRFIRRMESYWERRYSPLMGSNCV